MSEVVDGGSGGKGDLEVSGCCGALHGDGALLLPPDDPDGMLRGPAVRRRLLVDPLIFPRSVERLLHCR